MEATDKVRRNVDALTYKLLGIDVCKDYFLISSILYTPLYWAARKGQRGQHEGCEQMGEINKDGQRIIILNHVLFFALSL